MKCKLLIIALPIILAGCAPGMLGPINAEVKSEHDRAVRMTELARQGETMEAHKPPPIQHVDGLWLPSRRLTPSENKEPVNEALTRDITINRSFSNLQEVAERISALTGIPVAIAPEAASLASTSTATPPPVPAGMPPQGFPGMQGAVGNNLVYSGALSGFLDAATTRFGVYWEWENNGVRFFRTATKIFRLIALPGDTTLNAKISNQSGGSGSSPGGASGGSTSGGGSSGGATAASSQEASASFSGLSVWKGIEDSIKTMLTTSGKIAVTAATGTVTVTDTPQVLRQVEYFIDQQNISLSRQVVVNVRVLSVDLNNSDNYGINWDSIYTNLSRNFGMTLNNTFTPDVGATSLLLRTLGTPGAPGSTTWSGSNVIIDALSKQGRVSQVTSASVTTLNNQPTPIQVGRQTSYLASSNTTIGTVGAPSTTALQPGLITTGFSMNLVPHLLDSKRLLLQYAVDLSSLLSLATVESGGSSIQTPEIETRNFLQRVMLNSGDTLIVTGFEQATQSGAMQGVGDASNIALGGGVKGTKNKMVLVILIQPVIAN
jgi:type IVB pilus formation R64 PilN family outer membrane protein